MTYSNKTLYHHEFHLASIKIADEKSQHFPSFEICNRFEKLSKKRKQLYNLPWNLVIGKFAANKRSIKNLRTFHS